MKWTVVWHRAATDRLAEIWLASADRQRVSDAANRLDSALAQDPERKGREFAEFRVLDDPPLSAVYLVSTLDCLVTVVDVWPELTSE